MSSYDVIVIGSGAGGGTLVQRLAPSGKRILLLERGDWLRARAAELVRGGCVHRQPLHLGRHLVRRGDGEGVPAAGALLRRRRHQALRRGPVSTARTRTSASCAITTASPPRGRSATTRWSLTTRRPSSSTRCTARVARTRPSHPPARPIPSPPSPTSRASNSWRTTSPPPGYQPFHAPCGVMLNEADMAYSNCVRCPTCDGFPCLVHAKSDAEVLAVRPALEYQNVTLLRNAQAVAAPHQLDRHRRHGGRRGPRGHPRDLQRGCRRRRLRSGQLGQAAACLGHGQAPERPLQPVRPARAQLHLPQQPGCARPLQRGEPDGLPEDPRPQRLLLRQRRLRISARATSR